MQAPGIGNASLRDRACLACHYIISYANQRWSVSQWNGSRNTFLATPNELLCTPVRLFLVSGVVLIFFLYSWGESAGALSIGLHLVMNDGNSEGHFQGAFMLFESLCG